MSRFQTLDRIEDNDKRVFDGVVYIREGAIAEALKRRPNIVSQARADYIKSVVRKRATPDTLYSFEQIMAWLPDLQGKSVHQLKRPLQYSGLIATRRRNGHGLQQFYFFPAEEAGK